MGVITTTISENEEQLEERRGPRSLYYKGTKVQKKGGSKSLVLVLIFRGP